MDALLSEPRFGFLSDADRGFIAAFDEALSRRGFDCGGQIGPGYCWGRYMAIYAKSGVKNKKVAARIYMRDTGIALRLFFSGIDAHTAYLEAAPGHIREVFAGPGGDCRRCPGKPGGVCAFRKTYTLAGRRIEKCSGEVFTFPAPDLARLPDYLALFDEFYPAKRRGRQ